MQKQTDELAGYWSIATERLLSELKATPDGLASHEGKRRVKAYGPNGLIVQERLTTLGLLIHVFTSPFVLILLFAVALIVRTRRPFYKSRPGRWLMISTVVIAAFTIAVPYLP